ncbi:hypothetical protein OPV22_020374 [Ensete ventricosum]|uniref:Uncharacterized protein n=1 Tax=Ensete ventricosum TaxID=4639 RepID=A0AAV8QN55_ENSVE|nr:hypothetical protein OPV22_020374 [Ensete ventricosum]
MAEGKPKSPFGVWSTIKPFVNGGGSKSFFIGFSGLKGNVVFLAVLDVRKMNVRIQLGQGSAVEATKNMLANEGFGSFYKGLSAAGAIGACVGSPADLALIRMQADATLPAAQRRPTVVRAMTVNMGMLASYNQSVELFRDSLGFGEVSTVLVEIDWLLPCIRLSACSLPFDYVKTQIQKMPRESKYPTLKSGGLLKFYTGFPVYCVRIAPHIMMTWIFLNQTQKVEKSLGL